MSTLTACVERDEATKLSGAITPGIPGAYTQGASLDESHQNLQEALALRVALSRWLLPRPLRTVWEAA